MELPKVDESPEKVVYVNFNQDSTSLAVASVSCYSLYSLAAEDAHLDPIHENPTGDVWVLERLFSSSLIAMVLSSSPRRLKVSHFKRGTEICNYSYANNIVAVKLNRARLVVLLEEALYVHNIRDMKVLHTIKETPPNRSGVCALSPSNEHCYLAYPGSSAVGEIQVFDTYSLQAKIRISAHDSPLAAMAFDPTGTRLATASEKGTVIRIFNVLDGTRLCELRRGVKRCAVIYSLAFSADSKFLAASSNTETVHVFRTDDNHECKKKVESSQGWMGYLTKAVSVSASYLPSQVAEVLNQGRALATARLPFQGLRNVCALTVMQKQLRLLVAATDGYLYVYSIDSTAGGECQLVARHRLNKAPDSDSSAPQELSSPKTVYNESYAGKLKGQSTSSMTDSQKYREMIAATENPATNPLRLDDEEEFPPMTHQIN